MEKSLHKQALEAYKSMVSIAARIRAGEVVFESETSFEAFAHSYANTKKMLDYVATGDQDSVRRLYKAAIVKTSEFWMEKVEA
jgi:hypothetical protein